MVFSHYHPWRRIDLYVSEVETLKKSYEPFLCMTVRHSPLNQHDFMYPMMYS
jgi:hypothetical protein